MKHCPVKINAGGGDEETRAFLTSALGGLWPPVAVSLIGNNFLYHRHLAGTPSLLATPFSSSNTFFLMDGKQKFIQLKMCIMFFVPVL
jgi:hypothetical protein